MRKIILLSFLICALFSAGAQTLQPETSRFNEGPDAWKKLSFSGYKQSAQMNDYDVRFYFLDIALENNSTYIAGNVLVQASVTAPLDTFALELINGLSVDSVFVNGTERTFVHQNDHIYILLPSPLAAGTTVSTRVYYHGTPSSSGFFSGITSDSSPSWGNQATWTLSEPFNANQWWPCKQVLTDKADSSWVFITTSSTNKAGSNGMLVNTVNLGNGKTRYEWKSRNNIDYYLISVSVAEYVEYNIWAHPAGTSDSLLIQNYVYDNPACLPNFQDEIDLTDDFIELYSQQFGLYPFMNEKYGHCMAPMGGGMEHQTMTTLGFFEFYLICHELAHQWFGDNVTCASWQDIWVNEGFASYAEYLAADALISHTEAQAHMADVHSNVKSQPDGSVFVPASGLNDENRIFDGRLSYDKGSAIIHMIRFEMQNDSLFFKTLRDFQTIYGDGTATGDDFRQVCEDVSGKSFTNFFNQWYYGEGYPTYQIVWRQENDTVHVTATQTTSTSITPFFNMLMELRLIYSGGDTTIRWQQDAPVVSFKIPMNKTISLLKVDPNNWVVDGAASVTVSVAEHDTPAFCTLAPNPCSDRLMIGFPEAPAPGTQISLCDLTGRILLEISAEQFNQLNVSNLAQGVYLLKSVSGNDTFIQKFLKQ